MNNELKVLDKGFVRLLNISGAVRRASVSTHSSGDYISPDEIEQDFVFDAIDTDPALVARTSFAKGFDERTIEEDEKLVEYLIRNQHTTPLEMTTICLKIKAPIFVVRQFDTVRTRTKNEISGRYVILSDEWYIPEVVRGKHKGGNKQGSTDNLPEYTQEDFIANLKGTCKVSYERYLHALEVGVCPEQARMLLHLSHYTQFVWKQDLHNLMHFLSLRLDDHAQWETRQYAEAIYQLLSKYLPKSMQWFDEYRRKLDDNEKMLLLAFLNGAESLTNTKKFYDLMVKLAKRNGIKI